jgi:hypothetical protein
VRVWSGHGQESSSDRALGGRTPLLASWRTRARTLTIDRFAQEQVWAE